MILSLTYSATSQVITVNNKYICFDKAAAEQIENDIHARAVIDSVNNLIIAQYDSLFFVKEKQIKSITGDVKCLENDNLSLRNLIQQKEIAHKKEKRKWKFITGGSIVVMVLAIIF